MKSNGIISGKANAKNLFILNIVLVWISSSIIASPRIKKDNPVKMFTPPISAEVVGTVGGNIFLQQLGERMHSLHRALDS